MHTRKKILCGCVSWKKRKLPLASLRVCGFLSNTYRQQLMFSKVVCIFGLLIIAQALSLIGEIEIGLRNLQMPAGT